MTRSFLRLGRRAAILVGVILLTLLVGRAVQSQLGPPLRPWHTVVPDELDAAALDRTDWPGWLAAEDRVFAEVRSEVTDQLDPEDRVRANRYYVDSPLYTPGFDHDWNRSFVLEPEGAARGVVVLLHGLTDAPYSLRHVAELYRGRGYVAIGIRMPGHGTVPAGLTRVHWQDWLAAARLAVREARRRVPSPAPFQLVGYSNGAAIAMKYALDALDDRSLAMPDRIVLLSPMIGVSAAARFAGLAGLPAILPAFAKAAWLDLQPEFNPFKYNSFPTNGGRQSFLVADTLQGQVRAAAADGRIARLPPILAFQSVLDATVSTDAVVARLYGLLPSNGSELVLFDRNHHAEVGPLISDASATALARLLPPAPRAYGTTIVTNDAAPADQGVRAVTTPAGGTAEATVQLGVDYPRDVYSLSHIALPFPLDDSLYGLFPKGVPEFGVHLGSIAAHGERGALVVGLDTLLRLSCNPFYDYMIDRIGRTIPATP